MSSTFDKPTGGDAPGRSHEEIMRSPEFVDLKRRFRTFIFPMAALFLAWYALYVLLAAFAPDFMSTSVFGNVNVGLLFGLGQFVTTFAITMIYVWYANKKLDPIAAEIRGDLETRQGSAS